MTPTDLSADDLRYLAQRGIDGAEARRQLAILRHPPGPAATVAPCTVGDGIRKLDEAEHAPLLVAWRRAVEAGRLSKFVPASGAATRMFADLHCLDPGGEPSAAARTLFERRGELAFGSALEAVMADSPPLDPVTVAHALVEPWGLGYGELPKALIPFHHHRAGPRTAFVEQLEEGAAYLALQGGPCRVHFTVAAGHEALFERHLETVRGPLEESLATRLEVSFSIQDPASATLCVDEQGAPFRDADGRLLLRPSGHGALLCNLEQLDGDLVVIKNIDNILPAARQAEVAHWKRLLIGLLTEIEAALGAVGRDLEAGASTDDVARRLADALGLEPPATDPDAWVGDRLRRPLRVCGMVRNAGEPGGGPFWVRGADGVRTPQIVEAAQIDGRDSARQAAWRTATHFNPVDLVCSLRDQAGRPHRLDRFVDPATAFVSRKEHDGRVLWALERPGLWNGAMAGWNTVLVEVPATTFAPVKTVLDLLRPEHLPAD